MKGAKMSLVEMSISERVVVVGGLSVRTSPQHAGAYVLYVITIF